MSALRLTLFPILATALFALGACGAPGSDDAAPDDGVVAPEDIVHDAGYGILVDGEYALPPIPQEFTQGVNRRALVPYPGEEEPGTIEVDIHAKFLYLVLDDGMAMRYPIGVGRLGRSIRTDTTIRLKREWPGWTPTANMLRTEPEVYGPFAEGVPGGLASPLGSRALYLYRGNRDTRYRIHGTNDLSSIGNSGSAGCIRMFNHDIIDLFERVDVPTQVVMRSEEDSMLIEGDLFGRGEELPPTIIDPETIYGAVAEAEAAEAEAAIAAADDGATEDADAADADTTSDGA